MEINRKPIKIHMMPYRPETGGYAIEKDIDGKKSRYLCGVASGPKEDAHGERVTPNCIKSLVDQAHSGDVLLYGDVHGIRESEDIGILTDFSVTPNNEWYVEFRLYDASDKVGPSTIETADKLWKQVNGLPPYHKARKKGFSIEGYIPEDRVLMDAKERYGTIDDMVLEGVVVVPQPAYQDSVIHAVYKSLGETPPWTIRKGIKDRLEKSMSSKNSTDAYDREKWQIEATRDEMVDEAMKADATEDDLRVIFDEYRDLMIPLIINSKTLFSESVQESGTDEASPYSAGTSRDEIFTQLQAELKRWVTIQEEKGK